MATGFDTDRLARLGGRLTEHTEPGGVPGLAWLVARGGEVHAGAAGRMRVDSTQPAARDTIFRIASMSKPVTAVAALILVEECGLRLDDPVDPWLPELASPRVLAHPDGPLDDTVAAHRSITLRDLLTFRLGLGYDFTRFDRQPTIAAMSELGLGVGPPAPDGVPAPDEWMRRLGTVPLEYQPGERWLYHVGADVLSVLVARASGQPLDRFLHDRVFAPLGMRDTGFSVPPDARDRFGPCYGAADGTGELALYDDADGQWSRPPAFPSGGGGLVSTVDDYLAFAEMLRRGGMHGRTRILSRASVSAMTTDHLTDAQKAASGPDPSGAQGWGLGVGVWTARPGTTWSAGAYGWDGGLGSTWANDPAEDLVGILLTNQMFTSPTLPAVCQDFWTCAYAALDPPG
jgi:CubicO group peptidase (beta-lactamase class C family)